MNTLEEIRLEAFKDELQKIAKFSLIKGLKEFLKKSKLENKIPKQQNIKVIKTYGSWPNDFITRLK